MWFKYPVVCHLFCIPITSLYCYCILHPIKLVVMLMVCFLWMYFLYLQTAENVSSFYAFLPSGLHIDQLLSVFCIFSVVLRADHNFPLEGQFRFVCWIIFSVVFIWRRHECAGWSVRTSRGQSQQGNLWPGNTGGADSAQSGTAQ